MKEFAVRPTTPVEPYVLAESPVIQIGSLSHQESAELFECEKVIREGLDTFINVGMALCKIRDSRLYRSAYDSFEAYVKDRWSMSARQAHRLVDGAQIAQNLLPPAPAGPEPEAAQKVTNWSPPRNESQLRPLKGLEPAEQREVWNEANQAAGDSAVTARHVNEARERLHPREKIIDVFVKRVDEGGDIDRCNCHDLLKSTLGSTAIPVLEKVFEHDGEHWVVSLGHHGGNGKRRIITQEAHRLIRDSQYSGPKDKFFAEGRAVMWGGEKFRLGPMVLFRGDDDQDQEALEEKERGERHIRKVEVDIERADNGDIHQAQSCHLMGEGFKPPYKIKAPFTFEDSLWCVTSSLYARGSDGTVSHDAHRLIPEDEYFGPERRPHHYEGALVSWKGKRYRLGPAVLFWAKDKDRDFGLEVETSKPESNWDKIILAADQLIKDGQSLRVLAENGPLKRISTKQLLHLSIALTHLKNFRGSLEQKTDPQREASESAQKGNAKARRDAAQVAERVKARWRAAKAASARAPQPSNAGDSFVVSRTADHDGSITFRTANGGWAKDPDKAQKFPNATAAKFAAHHSYDKPMKLTAARRKAAV